MVAAVEVEGLSRSFRVAQRSSGFGSALRGVFRPHFRTVEAVRNLSFRIEPGERVAFVGPNGAGKSTTIKMLSGILHPSAGAAEVAGFVPWEQRGQLGYRIGTVFGQRSRLWLHLPAMDAFNLLSHVYDIERALFRRRLAELLDLFEVGELARQPVRTLSLGERMRCELVACLLHGPSVLFLDEPTIGLDVVAKARLRELILDQSRREGTTILLTSHDTGDMEQVCDRVIVINHGELLLDRRVEDLRRTYLRRKRLTLLTADTLAFEPRQGVSVVSASEHRAVLDVDTTLTPIGAVVSALMERADVQDLTIEDPPMDDIVRAIYSEGRAGVAV